MSQALKNSEGERMTDLFNIIRPLIAFTWENVFIYLTLIFSVFSKYNKSKIRLEIMKSSFSGLKVSSKRMKGNRIQ